LPTARVELATGLSLPELARRLAGCGAFLGHDSGITHLAAAVGLPLLALWGESTEAVWRPRGERVALLRAGSDLAHLPVEEVRRAVDDLLNPERSPAPRLAR
jgi:ADP-heptose:LPS heptosyltransferase